MVRQPGEHVDSVVICRDMEVGRRLTDGKGQEATAIDEAPGHTDSEVVKVEAIVGSA